MTTPIEVRLKGRRHLAIGLMSGTSHDGVTAALAEIDPERDPPAKVVALTTRRYGARMRARLLEASAGRAIGSAELSALNFELGEALARAALAVMRAAPIAPRRVSFIGSHGHTFFHRPPRAAVRGRTSSTLQLGEAAVIAARTGLPVVADFRSMDLALGGEGAPLAPLAHLWLFADRSRGRVIQNIGGIANATYIPARAREDDPRIVAFDTGPGVGVIDSLAARRSRGALRMDRDGRMAARGQVDEKLLALAMRHRYFERRPPKSTGREEFGPHFVAAFARRAARAGIDGDSLIATATALTARSIALACRRFIMPRGRVDQLIVAGGGAHNPVLVRTIQEALAEVEVITAARAGVDGDGLEAVAFAILAYRMLTGAPGNLPRVTGARAPAILGKLTLPP